VTDAERDAGALLGALYDELRRLAAARMARERPDHTLSPTALVHEAWLRIGEDRPDGWANRAQFFAAAAEAMRRILIEDARAKGRLRRGGDRQRIGLTDLDLPAGEDPERVLAIAEAVERLAAVDARLAEVAKLRLYAGLGEEEAATVLGTSVRTVRRDWQFARAWLFQALGG
jgi:RNA polymerase sigma factor (TIGR02999 family)